LFIFPFAIFMAVVARVARWYIFKAKISVWVYFDQGDQIGRIFAYWVTDYFG
jgi:hypothetical protein